MRQRAVLLQTTAALAWITAIAMSFTGADYRLWADARTAAGMLTLAALIKPMAAQAARAVTAVTRIAVTRPPVDGPPSEPLPALCPIAPYRQPGRHATQERKPA